MDEEPGRWEPDSSRHPRAPSSFDYREEYRENSRGTERGGDFHSYQSPNDQNLLDRERGHFGDTSRYAGSDDYYDHGGERWNPGRRAEASPDRRGRELGRRYEEHKGPGEGMMDLVRGFFGVGPKNYRRSDARIEEDASEALYRDPHVDASDIEVRVAGGVITLTGSVRDRWSKTRAEDVLEHILGVHDVQNRLLIGGFRPREETAAIETDDEDLHTFGTPGLPGTTTTGGFNNTVVVRPVSDKN